MDTPLPKLRAIEAFPVDVEATQLVCLRDPLHYARDAILVPYPAFFILTLLDGRRSLADVQEAFRRQYGTILPGDELDELLGTLDRHHFLDSPCFAARRAEVDGAFHAAPVRAPAHAGSSYPDDAVELRAHLRGFFADVAPMSVARALRGLVAPHIDLRVGGRSYGHAYAALAAAAPAARYVVLGTAHAPGSTLCTATRKDYATPLGTVTTDRDFIDRLAARVPEDLFRDEILHRTEHAVEFQVVMLQHVLGGVRPFSVVPILVTSLHELIASAVPPARDPRVSGFVAALRATLADDAIPTVVIAGVDFAHVGAKFGDRDGLTPELLALTERKDRALIAALEAGAPEAFFAALAADADPDARLRRGTAAAALGAAARGPWSAPALRPESRRCDALGGHLCEPRLRGRLTVPTLAEIRSAFRSHAPRVLEPIANHAAVAVVLHDAPTGSEMLFIQRAEHPLDPWSGHMAFPGGRVDPGDATPRHAAERETLEEVGIDLAGAELIGRLDDVDGAPPGLHRLVVSAFVYSLRPHGDLRSRGESHPGVTITLNHEVSDALWVPVPNLVDRARHVPFYWPPGQRETHYPGIVVGNPDRHVVWGLTYRFLELFFTALGRPLRQD